MSDNNARKNSIDVIYYPFSRIIDPNSTKQMLLAFDTITFLDPVKDDEWREGLMLEMGNNSKNNLRKFNNYKEISLATPFLKKANIMKQISPEELVFMHQDHVSQKALRDLKNDDWINTAKNPKKFNLPFKEKNKKPYWEIFKPKLPEHFIKNIIEDEDILYDEGDDNFSWKLSYEAGSSIAIATHISAAEELSLSPVTDSELHHQLLMLSSIDINNKKSPLSKAKNNDDIVNNLTNHLSISLIQNILPKELLEEVSFEDIISFREETRDIRLNYTNELKQKIVENFYGNDDFLLSNELKVKFQKDIYKDLNKYEKEINGISSKIFNRISLSFLTSSTGSASGYFLTEIPAFSAAVIPFLFHSLYEIKRTKDEKDDLKISDHYYTCYLSKVKSLNK